MKKKLMIIVIILLIGNALSINLVKMNKKIIFKKNMIPLTIRDWKGSTKQSTELTMNILGTNDVYEYFFKNKKNLLQLSIVYYADGQPAFHMPEGCTLGAGDHLQSKKYIKVNSSWGNSDIVSLQVQNKIGQKVLHYYAFATNEKLIGDYLKFRLHLIMLGLSRNIQSCALIRVSTLEIDPSVNADNVLRTFWKLITPYIKNAIQEDPGS